MTCQRSTQYARATDDAQVMTTRAHWSRSEATTDYFVLRMMVERTTETLTPAAFGYNPCSAVF